MGRDESKHSSKRRSHGVTADQEHRRKKRHRDREDDASSSHKGKHREKKSSGSTRIVDDDVNDDDMWVEKNIDLEGEIPLATDIPSAESLKLRSRAYELPDDPPPPKPIATTIMPKETKMEREAWMLEPGLTPRIPDVEERTDGAVVQGKFMEEDYAESPATRGTASAPTVDFFSSLGTEHRKKQPEPDPTAEPKVSHRELNTSLREGKSLDDYPTQPARQVTPGGPGSQWRMMKLRRVYETAEEEGRSIEEVALDRFGSLEAFEEAKEERRILDEREGRRASRAVSSHSKGKEPQGERLMFTNVGASGASSRSSSFRRPELGGSTPSTPSPAPGDARRKYDTMRISNQGGTSSALAQSHTPIPSVMTPTSMMPTTRKARAMSPSSLNKLQAKVLRAKLMNAPNADALEKEYEEELKRANGAEEDGDTQVELLPTLDVRGNLYDVGQGRDDAPTLPGNRKKKDKVEQRDPKTGELVRVNADDDEITLGEMLRREKFKSGPADQKNLDEEFARAIATDGGFQADLDYIDDNAEKLGRKKMRSDAMKRQFAINDYKKTQQVLANCPHCYGEDDSPPKAPVVAMGTRVYLSCTLQEELVDGHCLIVPIQHHLTTLEADDDVWDEIRNFMKCLMRMFAEQDKGVVFYETVISLRHQKHTFIECVPVPWDKFEDLPGYFRESILMSEVEWSQNKKLIEFSKRPGGFRRSMVPNLPYFAVQFDYKGEKGYGHVIEGTSEAADAGEENGAIDEGGKGSGEFPRYFAGEIIGNILDLEPRKWRRPKRIDSRHNKDRVAKFRKMYDKFDWTTMLAKQPYVSS